MHELPPEAERLLRAQGVTDAELLELRRTGRLEHTSPDGSSSISISTHEIQPGDLGAMQLDPAVLDKLQRFHRFIPAAARANLEVTTGVDLDRDGRIGSGATARGHDRSKQAWEAVQRTGTIDAAPPDPIASSANARGPFVQQRRGGSATWILLALLAVGAVAYLLLR